MNQLERLRDRIESRFPGASLTIDKPATETGSWWLDAELEGHLVVVEWRSDKGFGVSTPSKEDFGSKPHEVYEDEDAANSRIVDLLLGQVRTLPLQKIRESRRLSQLELASRLSINQGACSRMERRSDMLIGTLRNAVAAMGGELYLVAKFPDETVYIDLESADSRNGSGASGSPAA